MKKTAVKDDDSCSESDASASISCSSSDDEENDDDNEDGEEDADLVDLLESDNEPPSKKRDGNKSPGRDPKKPASLTKEKRKKDQPKVGDSKASQQQKSGSKVGNQGHSSNHSAQSTAGCLKTNSGDFGSSGMDITKGGPVTTDIAAKKLILQYFRQQNRPYSALQVHDNLHKRIPKSVVERQLTSLSQPDGGIVCKEYGKATIYYIDQSTMPSNFTAADIARIAAETDQLKRTVDGLAAEERQLKNSLQLLTQEPKDEELDRELADMEQSITMKRRKIEMLNGSSSSSGGVTSSSSSSSNNTARMPSLLYAVQAHNFYRKKWQERKLICMDMVDVISDGMGKKVKDIMADMCLETDLEAGVTLPAVLPEPKS